MDTETLSSLGTAESVRTIAFEDAQVRPGFVSDTWFLTVSGEAPCLNMDVRLSPRIYIDCPEYWGIEVIGSLHGGFCLTAIKPFVVTIALNGIIGSKGIEVLGGRRSERIEVSGGCRPGASEA
jgi:hypothetical protein